MMLLTTLAVAAPFSKQALLDHLREPAPHRCDTLALADARMHADELTADEQAVVDAAFPLTGLEEDKGLPPPPGNPTKPCFSQQKEQQITGEHFAVEWNEGEISSSEAQELLEALDYAWSVEVDELGWGEPDGASRYLLPAYVDKDYTNGAYTTVDTCGGLYAPYIVIGSNSFSDMDWTRTAAAHEFNHSIQFATSFAPEAFWWESTATYIEEYVYPDSNEWTYYVSGYSQSPELRFNADGQSDYNEFYHMYGMSIWAFYLDQYQGGPDIVRQTWEEARREDGYYSFTAEEMLEAIGLDYKSAYLDFIARNTVMEYGFASRIPEVDTVGSVEELPAEDSSSSKHAPEGYGQNYVSFAGDLGTGDLQVTFAGDDGVPWAVELVEVDKNSVLRTTVAESADDGTAVVTLEDYGGSDVFLVITPLDDTKKGQEYSWSAELVEPSDEDETDGSDDVAGDPKSPDEHGTLACGCATAGAPGAGVLALALLGGIAVSRRR